MAGVMIGTIMCILGLYSLIKGKLPFIKKYDGVKIKTVILMISILLICILTLILEIVLKAI